MYIILSLLCVIYYVYIRTVYGGLAFSEFFIGIAILLAIYQFTKNKIKENEKLYKRFKMVVSIIMVIFISVEGMIILFPKHNNKDKCDYMIILGAAVKHNTPSLTLQGRLEIAIEYLNRTDDDLFIVVSGGKGQDENISEALAMKNYLVQRGVDQNKIIMEDKSTSTYENFKYSRSKIEEHSSKDIEKLKVKVVTTDFHALRSNILAKRNGYEDVTFYTSNSLIQFKPTYYTREFFAFTKSLLVDK